MSGVDLLPAWPTSGDSEAAFNTKADALGPALATMITQINTALGVTNISAWVSGAAYTAGSSVVWSLIDYYPYRRKTTSSAGTTDPSIDTINWAPAYGTTEAQFDNSTKLATTAFVQRALGSSASVVVLNASSTLNASHIGKTVICNGTSYTVTLPLPASLPNGARLNIIGTIAGTLTIARQGADVIINSAGYSLTSVLMWLGDSLILEVYNSNWYVVGGSIQNRTANDFGSLMSGNGWKKIPDPNNPSGYKIYQWGSIAKTTTASPLAVTFPISFPNNCFDVVAGLGGASNPNGGAVSAGTVTASGFQAYSTSGQAGQYVNWIAIGN